MTCPLCAFDFADCYFHTKARANLWPGEKSGLSRVEELF